MQGTTRSGRQHFVLLFTAGAALCAYCNVLAAAAQRPALSVEDVYRQAALIAHVRVAGRVKFGRAPAYFVEILDSARGPAAGQFALVSGSSEGNESGELDSGEYKDGEQLILFAQREEDGTYRALPEDIGRWRISGDGQIDQPETVRALLPRHVAPTAAGAIAHLRQQCRERDVHIELHLNQRDAANYRPDAPLRVNVRVENAGRQELRFDNRIEYQFAPSAYVDVERLEKLLEQSSLPHVKIFVQPLGRLNMLRDMERMLQSDNPVVLSPSGAAAAEYDLADEFGIQGGGKFSVWAELGAHRSPAVLLELPESDEALRAQELKQLLDDGGPFRVIKSPRTAQRVMPPVEPTLRAQVIEAALACWFDELERPSAEGKDAHEIAILRTDNVPPEFAPALPGVQLLISDLRWRRDGEPVDLQTSRGPAVFRWRTVQIDAVEVNGLRASVKIRQNQRHNLGGSGGTIHLRRENGRWRVAGPVHIWQS